MNRKKEQGEQTKKQVAEAAKHLFAQKGYKGTSIEDIAAATGKSKGNIYYHFGSKEGLFQYLLDEWDRDWLEQWRERESTWFTITEKLQGLAEHIVKNDLNHPLTKAMDEFLSSEWDNSEVQDKVTEFYTAQITFYQEILQAAMADGQIQQHDERMLAVILGALMMGLGEMSRRTQVNDTLELYRQAMHVFLQGTLDPGT
ncbi:TetR/AcrR family transcriptional regulator [Paenibacillus sp. 7541]|uniref:TetR/AcrR family transcriptional regulator n=1 Tax=Paenibacillus sp. 7541 TaxID=2026236 RepID=UPI000BA58EB1|nr:TetR/AcrR family transcriptional regulator [Paenibacillus sp. 7541]PAK50288.1 TetR family transcriptional regulator [Paenibacillus sp. 7541]